MTTTASNATSPRATPCSPALADLARLSARIGADPALIQAAGGNTSVKVDGVLWVKASGTWLRDALSRELFAPVDLAKVVAAVAAGDADPVGPALRADLAAPGLRPSIETTLHALMPHAVVLHVHAVDVIAWALQPDAREALRLPLAGHRWAWLDYVMPGLPLTHAMARAMADAGPQGIDVLVMGNHGLVVGGANAAEAADRLDHVVSALRRPIRVAASADETRLAALAEGTAYTLPAIARSHGIATDALNLRRAQQGVPYPDHVVFLGATVACPPAGADVHDWLLALGGASSGAGHATIPPYVALPGLGVLARRDLDEGAQEMLAALADVLARLPATPEPVMLPAHEVAALLDWEAEKYRRTLAR